MLAAHGVGGLSYIWTTLARQFSCDSAFLSAQRTLSSTMHLTSSTGRCQARQLGSSSGAAAAAAGAPACVNLPRAYRGALASTSKQGCESQTWSYSRMRQICRVRHWLACATALACTQL